MASWLDKDDYIYHVDHLMALMASMDTEVPESGAHPKKTKRKSAKSAAGKSEGKVMKPQDPLLASLPESLWEKERLKNENLRIELEITKA